MLARIDDSLNMIERFKQTGSFLPYGVKCCINGEMITYAELKIERIKRQAEHLRRILTVERPIRRAGYLWTFYQPGLFGFAYMGWWAYLRILGQRDDHQLRWDIVGSEDQLALRCMELFPCGVFPVRENFDLWKEAFGLSYRRPGRFKDQGLAPIWVTLRSHGFPQIEIEAAPLLNEVVLT
jgi:hypothetical protein